MEPNPASVRALLTDARKELQLGNLQSALVFANHADDEAGLLGEKGSELKQETESLIKEIEQAIRLEQEQLEAAQREAEMAKRDAENASTDQQDRTLGDRINNTLDLAVGVAIKAAVVVAAIEVIGSTFASLGSLLGQGVGGTMPAGPVAITASFPMFAGYTAPMAVPDSTAMSFGMAGMDDLSPTAWGSFEPAQTSHGFGFGQTTAPAEMDGVYAAIGSSMASGAFGGFGGVGLAA